MYKFITTLALVCAATLGFASTAQAQATQQVKAVYHINTDVNTVPAVLNNIRNHMAADPKAKIVVVTHGAGINFLLQDAKDSQGREFSGAVSDLAGKGVEFRVCNNTLTVRNINPDRLLMETKIVPSGVAEVARLQALEGYVYLKP
ncbi:DsrE family protein [Rhodoferax sp. BAB1]|uniref:DsrE family protein n=1 Tax=Rhodoferax sp. BAB1 TaxID=2741720 RepID=UPI0015756B1E|nr:DsrE family protein [Rhodoferax sp. BAB1]QKO20488.1 DsrE family protein [Rhodoferax sp. BAB1]